MITPAEFISSVVGAGHNLCPVFCLWLDRFSPDFDFSDFVAPHFAIRSFFKEDRFSFHVLPDSQSRPWCLEVRDPSTGVPREMPKAVSAALAAELALQGWVVCHAALVTRSVEEGAVLLLGSSFSGKSTFCSAVIAESGVVYSDDLVALRVMDGCLFGFGLRSFLRFRHFRCGYMNRRVPALPGPVRIERVFHLQGISAELRPDESVFTDFPDQFRVSISLLNGFSTIVSLIRDDFGVLLNDVAAQALRLPNLNVLAGRRLLEGKGEAFRLMQARHF